MRQRQASHLRLSGNVIPGLTSFKFLGIVLDNRLSMVKHIEHIKAKCSKRLNPRPGGGLSHLRHGGGGGQNDHTP